MVRLIFPADTHSIFQLHRFGMLLIAIMSTLSSPIAEVFVEFFLNLNFRFVRTQRHPFFIITLILYTNHDLTLQRKQKKNIWKTDVTLNSILSKKKQIRFSRNTH